MKEVNIHHRHLIDDQNIRLQRIPLIPSKKLLLFIFLPVFPLQQGTIIFQQAVYRLCLTGGRLRHPLGGAPGRRRQKDFHPGLPQAPDDHIDGSCLPRSRSSRDHQQPCAHSLPDGDPLLLVQLQPLPLRHRINHGIAASGIPSDGNIEIRQHPGTVQFRIIQRRKIHRPFLCHNDGLVQSHLFQYIQQLAGRHLKPVHRFLQELLLRHIHITGTGAKSQYIQNTGPHPVVGIQRKSGLPGNLIRDAETHSRNVLRQLIRVLLYDFIQSRSIHLKNLHCQLI